MPYILSVPAYGVGDYIFLDTYLISLFRTFPEIRDNNLFYVCQRSRSSGALYINLPRNAEIYQFAKKKSE